MKKNDAIEIVETINKPHGFDFDLEESYRKLISSQFGGDPARGFCELIQNAIDSFPSSTPFEERRIDIATGEDFIRIADRGEGMSMERLNLLTTLGGTDKHDDPDKIGTFGIGFFSIFNPRLHTKSVCVRTRCGKQGVQLDFLVDEDAPSRPPRIEAQALNTRKMETGSDITVTFRNPYSVNRCLMEAERFMKYFPCKVFINGTPYSGSVWNRAEETDAQFFKDGPCHGFVNSNSSKHSVTLLCKYEHIMDISVAALSTGGHNMTWDLQDYRQRKIPYVPNTSTLVNHNGMHVTVSRDSILMDREYNRVADVVAKAHLLELEKELKKDTPDQTLILANQFVLASDIRAFLTRKGSRPQDDLLDKVARLLAEAKVYRLDGQRELVSLAEIEKKRTPGLPVFFSPREKNIKWLAGAFRHDFVVLPPRTGFQPDENTFYELLFSDTLGYAVNLDTVRDHPRIIEDLVDRGLVQREHLSPKCQIVGSRDLNPEEKRLLNEIDEILLDKGVKKAIEKRLHLRPGTITTAFFDLDGKDVTVATGLFEKDGSAFDNLNQTGDADASRPTDKKSLSLGLMRSHPIIEHITQVDAPHRAYYAVTFLVNELTNCQKMLVPYSPFRHWIAHELARDIRRALVARLLGDNKSGEIAA